MYRRLFRELTTVECTRTCEYRIACNRQNIHNEAVRSIREDFNFSMCLSIFKHILSGRWINYIICVLKMQTEVDYIA